MGPDDGGRLCSELKLDRYYYSLQSFKKDCGRYPTTTEGLSALIHRPRELKCRDNHWRDNPEEICTKVPEVDALSCEPKDCYGLPVTYESDGKTFYLKGSHGYSLSEQTPARSNGWHWDNPNPPRIPKPIPVPSVTPGGDIY
jgi:hypothetical protein